MYAGLLLSVKDKYSYLLQVKLSNALYILFLRLPKLHNVYSVDESYHIKHMDCMDVGDGMQLVLTRLPLRPKFINV